MKFSVTTNCWKSYPNACAVIGVFEKPSNLSLFAENINQISHGEIDTLLNQKIINGKIGQLLLTCRFSNLPNQPIIFLGCGKYEKFNDFSYKVIIQKLINFLKNTSIKQTILFLNELNITDNSNYWKIRQTISIAQEELYTFNQFKTNENNLIKLPKEIIFILPNDNNKTNLKNCNQAIYEEQIIADSIKLAKDLSNMPPNICNPIYFSKLAKNLENNFNTIETEIIDIKKMKELKMNAFLSVGQGSQYNPLMPIIKYQGKAKNNNNNNFKKKQKETIVLIGKGLTFDSGGISIKPSNKMNEMKYDMCGAAVVYAIIHMAAKFNLPLNIIGLLTLCENMISQFSFRPGDIITTLSGKTVEILDTDAEGRLILSDALTYAERFNPSVVISIATLTGACVVALGNHFSGLMSNNDNLSNDLIIASKQSKDFIWRLPLTQDFHNQLKSDCADMTNIGGTAGGAITAGCFLEKFSNKYPWAHLDIAGTAWKSQYNSTTSTGRPFILLAQYLINQAKKQEKKN